MKDLIGKMDAIQGVQTTGQPSTSTTQSGPKLLNERNESMDIGEAIPGAGLVKGALNLGGKAIGGTLSGLERVGNAIVQGTKGAVGGLANKSPQEIAAAAKASAATAAKNAASVKTSNAQAALKAAQKAGDPKAIAAAQKAATAAAKKAPALTGLQKAGDVASKVAKTALGTAGAVGVGYAGKKAYDALTKDDNKPEPSPSPAPSPAPSPSPRPAPVPDKPADVSDLPATDPTDIVKPVTNIDDMPVMNKPVPSQRPSILPPDTMSDLIKRTRSNIDSMDNEPEVSKATPASVDTRDGTGDLDREAPAALSDLPEKPATPSRDYSTGRPVDKELDTNYGTGNTRTDKDGRTYVRQKGVMGGPDTEQRSYASFGDFFNKIRGKGDVNGRMDEETEQLLDAITEVQEIARIANLSGVTLSEAKMKDLVSKKVKGSYGTEYQGDEDEDETTDKKSKAKDSEKKKRGGQFKGDKDTSGKEKFGGADDAMAAMGVGKAKKSKSLDKLPAKKHSLKEYFDETEAMMIAEAQHAGIMNEVADAMLELESALFESAGLLDEAQCLEHICECYPHEVKLFLDTGNLDPDLFHELSDHYKRHARVPHRIARERDVTPLFDLVKGLFEGDLGINAEVTQAEEPMEVDEGLEDTLQKILPKSMQPFNYDTAAAASKAQAPVKEASKPW